MSPLDQALVDRAIALGCVRPAFTRDEKPCQWRLWDLAVSKLSARVRESDLCAEKVREARIEADRIAGQPEEGPVVSQRFVMPFDPLASLYRVFSI